MARGTRGRSSRWRGAHECAEGGYAEFAENHATHEWGELTVELDAAER